MITRSAGHLKTGGPRNRVDDTVSGDKASPNCRESASASKSGLRVKFVKHPSKGQAMIVTILAMPVLVAALALGCDMAVMYANYVNLQRAADSAVLSGGGWLPDDTARAVSTARSYLTGNNVLVGSEIVSGPTVSQTTFPNDTIAVTLQRTVPHLFGRVLGINSADVRVFAKARIEPSGGAGGSHLVPIGYMCPSAPCGLVAGDAIPLPGENPQGVPGQSKLSPGNWGGLTFPNQNDNGMPSFASSVASGYDGGTIYTGTTSNVQANTGSYVDPATQNGLNTRYNAGSETDYNSPNPDDARIIEIPIVESWPSGSSTTINIVGFITALIVPDGTGTNGHPSYKAVVVSTAMPQNIPDPSSTNTTGPFVAVLVQ